MVETMSLKMLIILNKRGQWFKGPWTNLPIWPGAVLGGALLAAASAQAQQGATLRPIPAAECQQLAAQTQQATGIRTTASEDDFTDLADGADGRSCHISGSATDQAIATPGELIAKVGTIFAGWRNDLSRDADGPNGGEKGYVNGSRIATVEANWEPGPGVTCSDKEPLSSCKIAPQQKQWNIVIDVVEKSGK